MCPVMMTDRQDNIFNKSLIGERKKKKQLYETLSFSYKETMEMKVT